MRAPICIAIRFGTGQSGKPPNDLPLRTWLTSKLGGAFILLTTADMRPSFQRSPIVKPRDELGLVIPGRDPVSTITGDGIIYGHLRDRRPGITKPSSSRGLTIGDLWNDGRMSAVVSNMNAPPSLLVNQVRTAIIGWLSD